MRLPDFLIIGAMKAGTTTLYRDLEVNPACFFSADKEPHNLAREAVLTPTGLQAYAALFANARPEQLCAEASTGYTKRPTKEGVAARARRVLGAGLKVIYIVREPVARAISHHYHAVTFGQTKLGIDEAVRQSSEFIYYGRYAWQLEPWLEEFGRDQVLILRFETYTRDRARTIEEVSSFLGITPRPDLIDPEAVYNPGDRRPMHRGLWTRINRSPLYRRGLRALIPRCARELAYRTIFPRGPERPKPPTLDTVNYILERVAEDGESLRKLMGFAEPVWDTERVREKALQALDTSPSQSSEGGAQPVPASGLGAEHPGTLGPIAG